MPPAAPDFFSDALRREIIRSEQQRVNQRDSADFPLLPTEAPPLLPVAPPPPPGALAQPTKDATP